MEWQEMSDKEKVKAILADVFDYFVVPDEYVWFGTLKLPRGKTALPGFHWPVAYWDDTLPCWFTQNIGSDPVPFDPLQNLNDTWRIVEYLNDRLEVCVEVSTLRKYEATFFHRRVGLPFTVHADTPAEAICAGALRAVNN